MNTCVPRGGTLLKILGQLGLRIKTDSHADYLYISCVVVLWRLCCLAKTREPYELGHFSGLFHLLTMGWFTYTIVSVQYLSKVAANSQNFL
jgi:hypothetical protein